MLRDMLPQRCLPLRALCGLVVAVAFASPALAADFPRSGIRNAGPPPTALVGATVHVTPDRVVPGATLLVVDGRVEAVGDDVAVPDGYRVVDLEGRTVYPGLIDPFTEYGLPAREADRPGRGRSGRAPQYDADRTGARSWNEAVRAEAEAIAHFSPDAETAPDLRAAGFTAVLSIPRDGIFRGRSVVVSLGDGAPNRLVLRPLGPHGLAFDKGSSSQAYPASLMGSIALLRQTFLDAAWSARAREVADRTGAPAPEIDRGLAAIAAYDGPWLFESEDALSTLRAARVADEAGIDLIHVVGSDVHARVEEIAALDAPLVLRLSFPETPAVGTPEAAVDVDLADLRHWDRAPHGPRLLEDRGVRFAFTATGLRRDETLLANVRRAVRAGLSERAALAALTTVPAELAGIADVAGRLGAGTRADFVVTDGSLFEDGTRILATWIAGEPSFEADPDDTAIEAGTYSATPTADAPIPAFELVLAGDPAPKSGTLRVGKAESELRGLVRDTGRIGFRADLAPLGVEGTGRFTVRTLGDGLAGRAVLADGTVVAFTPRRTAGATGSDEDGNEDPPERDGKGDALVSRRTFPDVAYGLASPPGPQSRAVVLRGATLWTASEEGIVEDADLLLVDGRIAAIGEVDAPRDAIEIDGTGMHVTPGLIDEHSHLAISRGVNEGTHAVTSEVRIGDVVDPDDIGIYRALAGGVTSAQLLHGSANPIGGQAQVIKMRWGAGAEDLKFEGAPPTIKFALGENVKQSNWGREFTTRYPQTRMGVESLMRDAFLAAREHRAAHEAYAALDDAARATTVPPRPDLRLEALAEILEGARFVHCHSYVQSEILMLMRLAEELGFRIQTFTHILEGYKVAHEMAAHGAMASSFSDWWAYKFEVYDAIPYNTCLMHDAGVVVSVNSDSGEVIRRLNQEAGKSVLYCDLDPHEALKFVTINPARQLRVDDRVGSLEVGKDADVVLWNGPPLSMTSRVETTWVDGVVRFDRARDAEEREAVRAERHALIQKALAAGGDDGGEGSDRGRKRPRAWHCDDVEDVWHD